MNSGPVPLIDIGAFADSPQGRVEVARQVDLACRELGFLIIENHGVAGAVIQECWDQAVHFFDSPLEHRLTATSPVSGHPYGYHGFAAEALAYSLDEATPPDLKETFNVGPLGRPAAPMEAAALAFAYADNLWPDQAPEFRTALENYYRALRGLADRVMEICAVALDLPGDFFRSFFSDPISALRVINYPDLESKPEPGQLRAGAHTDYGTLTLLLQQPQRSGLQVRSCGKWHDVPALPGTFVINIGDLMARWTNDRWVSTLHRVVNPPHTGDTQRRQSLVFFHTPNWDAKISCLPTCLDDSGKPLYKPVLAGPHLAAKFAKTVL